MQNKTNTALRKKRFTKKLLFWVLPVLLFAFSGEVAHAGFLGFLAENTVGLAFKALLYGLFEFIGIFTSIAITLFAYVIDPQYISGDKGLLNLQAVYDMWKFVRDFINIFFILGLLFIAFAFVFQIESYSNSKTIIKLIIAALLVNFSFPIARVIIDLANVPMYFFLQMIVGNGDPSSALSSSLSASKLDEILLPNSISETTVATLLAAIIFLFIFNITIFVFAFQFLIRIIALIILVILSPIGFVASGIPGLKKYGSQWWDNFLKYCFFGPAAIFMLLLATNFFAAISNSTSGSPYGGVSQIASGTSSEPGMVASMVLFFIPITMLWFAMSISDKFSIAGASVATKYGKDFAKFIGKKTASPVTNQYRGAKAGFKKGLDKGNLFGFNYGKTRVGKYATGKYWDESGARAEATTTGFISGGSKGVATERDKMRRRRVAEKVKENKENGVTWSELIQEIDPKNKKDEVTRQAAALALAESGAIQSTQVMYQAIDAIKNEKSGSVDEEYFAKIIDKAKGDAFDDVSHSDFAAQYAQMANDESMYLKNSNGEYVNKKNEVVSEENRQIRSGSALDIFNNKAKQEGEIMVRANFDMETAVKKAKSAAEKTGGVFNETMEKEVRLDAMKKRIDDLNADTLAKQGSIFAAIGNGETELVDALKQRASKDPGFMNESMKKMKAKSRQAIYDSKIMEEPRPQTQESQVVREKVQKTKGFNRERAADGKANKAKPIS